tara:strand:+ start:1618 stop:3099 length:1482 start_codon:yes stop_codon:yes gene_type:complete
MSVLKFCGQVVTTGQKTGQLTGGTSSPSGWSNGNIEVANITTITLPCDLIIDDVNRPFVQANYSSSSGDQAGFEKDTIGIMGYILEPNGGVIVNFIPGFFSSPGVSAVADFLNPVVKVLTPNLMIAGNILPAGDYTIVTQTPVGLDRNNPYDNVAAGTGFICIQGTCAGTPTPTPGVPTPVPTVTGIPTPTPTPTPVPTPTPTPFPTVTPGPTPIPSNPVPAPLIPIGRQYTLTYSENSKGWPSFYSYNPDYMVGMNNYFYTFSGANLFRHNTNPLRNNYYGEQYNSSLTSVINELPITTKIFQTINLQSDEPWTVTLNTDLQNDGFISNEWFELKEGSWYAAVKNTTVSPTVISNFASRAINGIGRADNFTGLPSTRQFDFISNPSFSIGSILSIGDFLYYNNETTNTPELAGEVIQININLQQNINNIVVDASIAGATDPDVVNPYVIGVKNNTAESYGLLGHFCRFTIENSGPSPTELFAVQAEIMKSYP